jgi:NADH:ubiquinone reductase (H+-translocating)
MRLRGQRNVWAIGDCAVVMNARDGRASPPSGQFAERQGTQCAENIARAIRGERTVPFSFRQLGQLCSIGGRSAVAEVFGLRLSGFLAWFVWRGVYLFKLPLWERRFQVGFDWGWNVLFPRDLANIRARQSDRFSHAHYRAGDWIYKSGDAPVSFYVIEEGEVELIRPSGGEEAGEVVRVLGRGEFFGERALLTTDPRAMSARARTEVELLVLGKNVFSQISRALAPLGGALASALDRRRPLREWKEMPEARRLLEGKPVTEVMDPIPEPLLEPGDTLLEVGRAFAESPNDAFYVSRDGRTIEGVVTLTDLLRARSGGAGDETPLEEFMVRNPAVVPKDENCAGAAETLARFRLKALPVVEPRDGRRIVGCLRARRLLAYLLKEMRPRADEAAAPSGSARRDEALRKN